MFPSCLLIFNITTNVAYLFVNTRGDAYISIHFFVSLEMANKVDITNNTLCMFCVIRLLFFCTEQVNFEVLCYMYKHG